MLYEQLSKNTQHYTWTELTEESNEEENKIVCNR
jgi:hypothetical protein